MNEVEAVVHTLTEATEVEAVVLVVGDLLVLDLPPADGEEHDTDDDGHREERRDPQPDEVEDVRHHDELEGT